MHMKKVYKYVAYYSLMFFYCIGMNVALAAPCVLDQNSPKFLIPDACFIGNFAGVEFNNLRYGKVDNNPGFNLDNDPGNVIRFGMASYSFLFFIPIFDTREAGCPLTFNASLLEPNDEIAFYTAAFADRRSVSIAWVLDCEIIQDR